MPCERWPKPQSRNVGFFTDLSLYSEALEICAERGSITAEHLRRELRQRTQGLVLVEEQSNRVAKDLVRELFEFGWLERNGSGQSADKDLYTLAPDGAEMLSLSSQAFYRHLAIKMQERYTMPGWFVARIWKINPEGQGEVILPSPLRDWRPGSRPWEEKEWTDDLRIQVLKASRAANLVSPGSFPIDNDTWVQAVSKAWAHLGTWKQKRKGDASGERVRTFSPRNRLTLAMRTAAVELLFGITPPGRKEPDIWSNWRDKSPLLPRTFRVWCPRLADLELIFYSDRHPNVVGRLIFPTSIFRSDAPHPPFTKVEKIQDPDSKPLWLYQPDWRDQNEQFLQSLVQTHRLISRRVGTLYISLLDVRDEVCRQLRLSSSRFDMFLAQAFRESLRPQSAQSISIETDIREDQRSGSGLARRPVWIDGVPYSLIAIGKTEPS